jgi:hypothetical protein
MRRWKKVSDEEVHEILTGLAKKGRIENGCTWMELNRRYGKENVKHKMGVGWYKLVPVGQTMTEYLLLFFIATAAIAFFAQPLRRDLSNFVQRASGGITIDWGSSK